MSDVFPIYEQLWHRAQVDGVVVHYAGMMGDGEAGYFVSRHDENRKPLIAIFRPYYVSPGTTPTRDRSPGAPLPPPDLVEELITLAHEYGHWRSFAGRTPRDEWDVYYVVAKKRSAIVKCVAGPAQRAALHDELTDDDRDRIMREETLAWTIAREVIVDLGLDDAEFRQAFDTHAERGLHNHRYRLGIDELRDDDV